MIAPGKKKWKTRSFGKMDISRRTGTRSLGSIVEKLTRDALAGKTSDVYITLVMHWPAIVGGDKARVCQPGKLTFPRKQGDGATLMLQVSSAAATEIQHQTDWLLERINGFFGRHVVGKLQLQQARLAATPKKPETPARSRKEPDPEAMTRMEKRLEGVDSPELREALRGLGRSILSVPDKD